MEPVIRQTLEDESNHNQTMSPQWDQFQYKAERNFHYRKSAIFPLQNELTKTFTFVDKSVMSAYENLILTTKANPQISLETMVSRLDLVRWTIGPQIILEMSGPDLLVMLRFDVKLFELMNKKYVQDNLIIPLQQLITPRTLEYIRYDEVCVQYQSKDPYECFCHGFERLQESVGRRHYCSAHVMLWQYAVLVTYDCHQFAFKTIDCPHIGSGLSYLTISDLIIAPQDTGPYQIRVNDFPVLRGDHPLNQMETDLNCDSDKYYYHSIKSDNIGHLGCTFGGLLVGQTMQLTIDPPCPRVKIFIKYKTILQYGGGGHAQISPTLQEEVARYQKQSRQIDPILEGLTREHHSPKSYLSRIDDYIFSFIRRHVIEDHTITTCMSP